MDLKSKKVLITGSSSGIGQAIAIAFAQKGATVLIAYRKNQKGAEETLEKVKKYSQGFVYKADLIQIDDVKNLFEAVKKDAGEVDILVNNAGDAQPGNLFDEEKWKSQYESILLSAVHASQYFAKSEVRTQRKIINISSIYGGLAAGNPEYIQYSAMKAALNSLTMNLAKSFGKNILVNAISPGYTWTPPWERISSEEKERYAKATKIERFVEPSEIAHIAIALAENDAITGQIIAVDGGLSLLDLNAHEQ